MSQDTEITLNGNILEIRIRKLEKTPVIISINNQTIFDDIIDSELDYNYPLTMIFTDELDVKIDINSKVIREHIHRDINSYFKDLKKCMLGKNDNFFLVNDVNEEIRQHYDENYHSEVDYDRFKECLSSKREFLEKRNINYNLFVVPDKSITLREYLPFKTNTPRRHVDNMHGYIIDLDEIVTEKERLSNDTHVSVESSLKIVPFILSRMHNVPVNVLEDEIRSKTVLVESEHFGDLLSNINMSYDNVELYNKNRQIKANLVEVRDEYEIIPLEDIPAEFRYVSKRTSKYFKNSNSISDKRALILHDSTTEMFLNTFISYYREVFFYWDHWFFNKDLVEYLKPDDVMEIRTERFLEHPKYIPVSENTPSYFPLTVEIEDFKVTPEELNLNLRIQDVRRIKENGHIKIFIDDNLIKEDIFKDGKYSLNYPLNAYEEKEYTLGIYAEKNSYTRRRIDKKFTIQENIEELFKDLKLTLKGKNNTFFRIHDNTNEIIQHYNKNYKSRIDFEQFKKSIESKRDYAYTENIEYKSFIIPDKSIVLSKYLPFKHDEPIRNVSCLKEYLVDLYEVSSEDDYIRNDTMLDAEAAIKYTAFILNSLYSEDMDNYSKKIYDRIELEDVQHKGNLFTSKSWSYDKDEVFNSYLRVTAQVSHIKCDAAMIEDIPYEFKTFSSKNSRYYENNDPIIDKRVLIIHDSGIDPFINAFVASFSEVFFYYDHWYFNKYLVEWFKPDLILEIREERTLDNSLCPIISHEGDVRVPVSLKIQKIEVEDNNLSVELYCEDLRKIPVNSTVNFSVDGKSIKREDMIDGRCKLNYLIENYSSNEHVLEISLYETSTSKAKILKKKF